MSEDFKKNDELDPKEDIQDEQEPQEQDEKKDDKGGQEEKPSPSSLSDDERTELLRYRKMDAIRAAGITNPQDIENMLDRLHGIDDPVAIQARIDDTLRQLRLEKYKEAKDPVSLGNGVKSSPKPRDLSEEGRELARRILSKRRGYSR